MHARQRRQVQVGEAVSVPNIRAEYRKRLADWWGANVTPETDRMAYMVQTGQWTEQQAAEHFRDTFGMNCIVGSASSMPNLHASKP